MDSSRDVTYPRVVFRLWTPPGIVRGRLERKRSSLDILKLVLNPFPIVTEGGDNVLSVIARTLTADRAGVHSSAGPYDFKTEFEKTAYCLSFLALQAKDPALADQLLKGLETIFAEALISIGICTYSDMIARRLEPHRHLYCTVYEIELGARGGELLSGAVERSYDFLDEQFRSDWGLIATNRYLFRTTKGHLGLGPRTVQVGDQVGISQGSLVPHIFLRLPNDPEDVRDFVGESYVYGIMYGELGKSGRLQYERMTLY
ncbi:hypothetical protein FZEAL_787 [Fusarium zealandicum]|uniref:Uncharacterized protein n=1 Tax=Fusarium zealandicum TaxID=1053134 RepID=A0A8H4XQJ9_9HYPO|nr:hypothetical protein FZEAL_787 [Fusarium zealandicum]